MIKVFGVVALTFIGLGLCQIQASNEFYEIQKKFYGFSKKHNLQKCFAWWSLSYNDYEKKIKRIENSLNNRIFKVQLAKDSVTIHVPESNTVTVLKNQKPTDFKILENKFKNLPTKVKIKLTQTDLLKKFKLFEQQIHKQLALVLLEYIYDDSMRYSWDNKDLLDSVIFL